MEKIKSWLISYLTKDIGMISRFAEASYSNDDKFLIIKVPIEPNKKFFENGIINNSETSDHVGKNGIEYVGKSIVKLKKGGGFSYKKRF